MLATSKEMADLLNVSVKTFRRYVKKYRLPFYGPRSNMRFKEKEVLDGLRQFGERIKLPESAGNIKPPKPPGKNEFYKLLGL